MLILATPPPLPNPLNLTIVAMFYKMWSEQIEVEDEREDSVLFLMEAATEIGIIQRLVSPIPSWDTSSHAAASGLLPAEPPWVCTREMCIVGLEDWFRRNRKKEQNGILQNGSYSWPNGPSRTLSQYLGLRRKRWDITIVQTRVRFWTYGASPNGQPNCHWKIGQDLYLVLKQMEALTVQRLISEQDHIYGVFHFSLLNRAIGKTRIEFQNFNPRDIVEFQHGAIVSC